LIEALKNALLSHKVTSISYFSEWLGYLPYGQYHWITVNDEDITSSIKSPDTMSSDLEALVSAGRLVEIARYIRKHDDVGPNDIQIDYKLSD